jgi:hypothetical protein
MAITKPFTFRAGEKARANEVNQDFDVLYAEVNRIGSEIIDLDVDIQSVTAGKAEVNGNATQRFQAAPGVNPYDVANISQLNQLLPVGTVIMVPHENDLEGFIDCDGTAYQRSTYQELFDVIGTTYGAGDGTNTFNVPDFRGRVAWGKEDDKTLGYREAGLPNITAWVYTDRSRFSSAGGAFYIENSGTSERGGIGSGNGTLHLNASRSSSVYGKSNTVQPPSTVVRFLIKYI